MWTSRFQKLKSGPVSECLHSNKILTKTEFTRELSTVVTGLTIAIWQNVDSGLGKQLNALSRV